MKQDVKIKKVFLSSNENPLYIQFWPMVATIWKRFGVDPILALVTDRSRKKWSWMEEFGEIVHFNSRNDLPEANWTKVTRFITCSEHLNDISIVSDVDMLPINKDYLLNLPETYSPDNLILKSYDAYPEGRNRKFPICYMIARGTVWKEILNPNNLSIDELIMSYCNLSVYDHKESLNGLPFSDESLLRVLVYKWNPDRNRIITQSRPHGWPPVKTRIDRACWHIDLETLHAGKYIDCHCLRPLSNYFEQLRPILDYLKIDVGLMTVGIEKSQEMVRSSVSKPHNGIAKQPSNIGRQGSRYSHVSERSTVSRIKRILIIQENGRHIKNRQFRECFSIQRAFNRLNVTSDIWGFGHDNFDQPFETMATQYDAVLSLENYDEGWHPELCQLKIPKAFWCIDAHTGMDRYLNFVRRHQFDVVFNATEAFVDRFAEVVTVSLWLPNAYDSFLLNRMPGVPKIVPVGFCGNVANRGEWIEHLKKRWGIRHDEIVIGPDMVHAVNRYQIHWNRNIGPDTNYRTFETLGCGTFLLTNHTPDLDKLFTIGKHLVAYEDKDDMDEKIFFYLSHPEKMKHIAQQGYDHVRRHHTYQHRAAKILQILGAVAAKRWDTAEINRRNRPHAEHLLKPLITIPEPDYRPDICQRTPPACKPHQCLPKALPIAFVTETMNCISGGIRCIAEVLNRLSDRGYQTACFVTYSDLRCDWLSTRFSILPATQLHGFKGILVSPYSPTAELVARSNAISKFYWVHSYEPKFPEITGRSDQWRIMSENSYRLLDLQYMATSSYVKMILELIYKRDVISPLVPGGVNTDLFRPKPKGNDPLRVVFLSREDRFRGAHDVVQALRLVYDQGVDLDICVMGQMIDMDNLPHQHLAPLPQSDFAQLLGSADIFIHASHFEGLPLPPLEAMATKCAVIATYVGASDYLLNGYNALVIPPKRPDKIAEALKRLVSDPGLRRQLGEGGFWTVKNNYTWEHTVDRLEEVLSIGLAKLSKSPISPVSQQSDRSNILPEISGSQSNARTDNTGDTHRSNELIDAPMVSAIVSTHNSERFIRGCLEDLEAQTIADKMEIIVIDSGSEQSERNIVEAFQKRFNNIVYIRTEERETVYTAWNRGIKAARGKFVTNANTDDRHHKDAIEKLTDVLEKNPDIALAYADSLITNTENETFETQTPVGKYRWPDFSRNNLLSFCIIGPQPVWRRSLHQEFGFFNERYQCAGDYEFWLRVSEKYNFIHIPEYLGLYWMNEDTISMKGKRPKQETEEIQRIYRKRFQHLPVLKSKEENIYRILHKLNLEKMCIDMLVHSDMSDNLKRDLSTLPSLRIHQRSAVDGDRRWDVIFFSAEEIDTVDFVELMQTSDFRYLVVSDTEKHLTKKRHTDLAVRLTSLGCVDLFEDGSVFEWTDPSAFGEILYEQGEWQQAIRCFEKVLSIDPANINALNNLGVISFQLKDMDMAEKLFERALRLDRRHLDSLNNLAEVHMAKKQYEKAQDLSNRAIDIEQVRELPRDRFTGTKRGKSTGNRKLNRSLRQSSKRVLIINNLYPPQEMGGYGRKIADMASILRSRGHAVHVLTSDTRKFGKPEKNEPDVKRLLSLFGEWTPQGMVEHPEDKILETIQRNDAIIEHTLNEVCPDICLVGNIDLMSAYVFKPMFQKQTPVLHYLGSEFIGYSATDTPKNPLYYVTTASQWLKDDAINRGYPFDKAVIIYPGAHVREFDMPQPPETDKLRIAYAGLVNSYKGPQVLLDALYILHREGIEFSATIAGGTFDEKFVHELKNTVHELNMADRIQFTGLLNRDQLKDLYAKHNTIVFPSLVNETFGISQVEGMAAGLILISSATGGAKEVMEDGSSGLCFTPGDHGHLSKLLIELTQDRVRWEQIACEGQRRVMENFDIEQSVDRLEAAFEIISEERGMPRKKSLGVIHQLDTDAT